MRVSVNFIANDLLLACHARYHLNTTRLTWQDAGLACQRQGMELALPATAAEDTILRNELLSFDPTCVNRVVF